jgi:hypothetical protein
LKDKAGRVGKLINTTNDLWRCDRYVQTFFRSDLVIPHIQESIAQTSV